MATYGFFIKSPVGGCPRAGVGKIRYTSYAWEGRVFKSRTPASSARCPAFASLGKRVPFILHWRSWHRSNLRQVGEITGTPLEAWRVGDRPFDRPQHLKVG